MMGKPALLVRDPELIKNILIKDFSSFRNNDIHVDEKIDPMFGKNPFCLRDDKWKLVRGQITPSLTIGKVKAMFSSMLDVNDKLVNFLRTCPESTSSTGISSKELAAKYTTDVVAASVFGVDGESFTNPNAAFHEIGKQLFELDYWNAFKFFLMLVFPKLADLFNQKFLNDNATEFFRKMTRNTVEYREKNNVVRNDYFDYLIHLRDKCTEYKFDEEHMAAHVVTFFTDGVETSSIALSYALYELAANPDVFQKLRDEIDDIVSHDGDKLTFEGLQRMSYLNCVLSETLRKHPPVLFLNKLCTSPYTMPNYTDDDSGPNFELESGVSVIVPVYAMHRDEKYFPDAERFDPDRFSDENKDNIVKCTYLPFSEGPRICLGMRLAIVQVKAAIATIVKNFDIKLNEKTSTPLEPDPRHFLMAPKGGIWLNFEERR